MPPTRGSIHSGPRKDSGAVRLWQWAKARRSPWTIPEAAAACGISAARCRAMVAAFREAGIIEQAAERENLGHREGLTAASWRLSPTGRAMMQAPVMIVQRGVIKGARLPA